MDLSRNLEALAIPRLDLISLHDLESKAERNIGLNISEQQVLNTYLGWLKEQLVQDSFNQQGSLVENWIESLRCRGFEKEHIHRSFKDWQRREVQADPSTCRRFLIVEVELGRLLSLPRLNSNYPSHRAEARIPPSSGNENENPLSSQPFLNKENKPLVPKRLSRNSRTRKRKKASKRVRLDNPERIGVNGIPVFSRRSVEASPPSSSGGIIEIMDHGPSEPDGQPGIIIDASTHGNNGDNLDGPVRMDSEEIMITRETIILDSPQEPILPSKDPHNAMPQSRAEYLHGVISGTLDHQPPGPAYICKRCKLPGHWIHLCPTNLDPAYDTPPPRDYVCKFCRRTGQHFATLCPENDKDWSLTQLRKKAGIRMITKSKRQRSPTRDRRGDSYRPEGHLRSRHNEAEVFRFGRDEQLSTHRDSPSPYLSRRARERSPDSIPLPSPLPEGRNRPREDTRDYRADHYHTGGHRRKNHGARMESLRRDEKPIQQVNAYSRDAEGRLAYEDEDVYMVNGYVMSRSSSLDPVPRMPQITSVNASPNTSLSGRSYVMDDDPIVFDTFVTNGNAEDCAQAASIADEFLQLLRDQIPEDRIAAICASELNAIMEDVCGEDDPNLVLDKNNTLCRAVTNPPFSDEVVRLFAGRSNPVIHPRNKRKTAVEVAEQAEQSYDFPVHAL